MSDPICDDPLGVKLTQKQMPPAEQAEAPKRYRCDQCNRICDGMPPACPNCGGVRWWPMREPVTVSQRHPDGEKLAEAMLLSMARTHFPLYRMMPDGTVQRMEPDRKRLLEARRLVMARFRANSAAFRMIDAIPKLEIPAMENVPLNGHEPRLLRSERRIVKAYNKIQALLAKAR